MAGRNQMPGFGAALSRPKIQHLGGYVRRLGDAAGQRPQGPAAREGARCRLGRRERPGNVALPLPALRRPAARCRARPDATLDPDWRWQLRNRISTLAEIEAPAAADRRGAGGAGGGARALPGGRSRPTTSR